MLHAVGVSFYFDSDARGLQSCLACVRLQLTHQCVHVKIYGLGYCLDSVEARASISNALANFSSTKGSGLNFSCVGMLQSIYQLVARVENLSYSCQRTQSRMFVLVLIGECKL